MPKLLTAIVAPLAGAMLITIICGWALAESPIEFHPCSLKTCKEVTVEAQKALGAGDTSYLLPSQIAGLTSVAGCAECTKLVLKTGKTVFVTLPPATVACMAFGGPACDQRVKK